MCFVAAREVLLEVHREGEFVTLEVDGGVEQTRLDALALAGSFTVIERLGSMERGQRGRVLIDDDSAGRRRRVVAATGVGGEPGHRLIDEVLPRPVCVRSRRAVARDFHVDDVGVQLGNRLVVERESLHHAGAEVVDQNVCVLDDVRRNPVARVRFQIDSNASLIPVHRQVAHASSSSVWPR